MKNPFPGMDPFLERHWRSVHATFLVYAQRQLNRQLPADLISRVEEGVAVATEESRFRIVYPDARVVEDRVHSSVESYSTAGVQVSEPFEVSVESEFPPERHLEIIDSTDGNRVITVIELLSPTNKNSESDRAAYRRKQAEYIQGRVNLVEIDLLRGGQFALAMPESHWPSTHDGTYKICIRRVVRPDVAQGIGVSLREKLPNVPIPLRSTDPDAVLSVQPIIDDCYRDGRYDSIDYTKPRDPPLEAQELQWLSELLVARKNASKK